MPKSFEIPGEAALALHRVSKRFCYDTHRRLSMRQWFIHRVLRQPLPPPPGFSIADLDLTIANGEAVAVVGANGSGKSTLLRLMGGIYHPSSGRIERHGRLAAVLELGAGFHPELTGAENIQIYAAVLGLEQRRFKEMFPAIIEFAGIDDVLDMPVKHYSTGMQARLALSVALSADSDILVLDEALTVGDRAFREKVKARMQAYHRGAARSSWCPTTPTSCARSAPGRSACARVVWSTTATSGRCWTPIARHRRRAEDL